MDKRRFSAVTRNTQVKRRGRKGEGFAALAVAVSLIKLKLFEVITVYSRRNPEIAVKEEGPLISATKVKYTYRVAFLRFRYR